MKRNRKPRIASFGVVSEATLRSEDLIPAFLDACDSLSMTRADRHTAAGIRRRARRVESNPYWSEDASEDVNTLIDVLSNYAPYCGYFGTSEGDGACFGFFLSSETLDESVREGEVWKDPGNGEHCPESARYRLVVSDHGNPSLYYRNGREVWSLV